MNNIKILSILILIILIVFGYKEYAKYANTADIKKTDAVQNKELKTVRVSIALGTSDIAYQFLLDLAAEKGFFEKNGLKVEKIISNSNPILAVKTGSADMSLNIMAGSLIDYLNDVDLRAIAIPYKLFDYSAISRFPKSEYKKIKIAGSTRLGGGMQVMNMIALSNIGIDYRSIEFVALGTPSAIRESFKQGRIDFMLSSNRDDERDAIKYDGVWSTKEISSGHPIYYAYVSTPEFIDKDTDLVRSFALSNYEALKYMDENKKDTIDFFIKKYGISAVDADEFYDHYLAGREGVTYIPTLESVRFVSEIIKNELKPTDPGRDLNGFVEKKFAEEAVNSSEK